MLVIDLRPAATVEGVEFKQLIHYFEPDYKVPSATHMVECLTDMYETAKGRLTEVLKNSQHIALSTDIWTSTATQAYITVTAHFISPDWVLKTFVLQTISFPKNHTGKNIAEKVKGVLANFCLDCGGVLAAVHDQSSNMEAFAHLIKAEFGWETHKLCSTP